MSYHVVIKFIVYTLYQNYGILFTTGNYFQIKYVQKRIIQFIISRKEIVVVIPILVR